jgi:general secretion pathway protein N
MKTAAEVTAGKSTAQKGAFGKWIACGAVVGLVCVAFVFAPASWLASAVVHYSQQQVLLMQPRGTVWDGSADMVLAGGEGSSGAVGLPTRLYWQISPAWLGFKAQLHSPCCAQASSPVQLGLALNLASTLRLSPELGWQMDAARLQLPTEMLAGLGAPWNTVQLTGDLSLKSDKLAGVWSSTEGLSRITGGAQLDLGNASTALSTVRPLGSYRLSSKGAVMRLETLGSETGASVTALILTGTGQIEQGRASFQGEAVAVAGFEEALSNLLHIVGQWQPGTDGRSRSILKL